MTLFAQNAIDVSYGDTQILWDVSLTVESGETVSLIGRNGVGKTTLMKTAIGELSPTAGTIVFQGEDITNTSADERARMGIGYVPQNRDVFPNLTVEENLKVGELVNSSHRDALYDEVYEYFPRIEERRQQKAGTMSGGEQQMLAIARVIVGGPELLLLDEPSEGVQPSIVQDILRAIQLIKERLGTSIFFVEQNLDFTISASDTCYVMEKGRIVEQVNTENLRDSETVQKYLKI